LFISVTSIDSVEVIINQRFPLLSRKILGLEKFGATNGKLERGWPQQDELPAG